MSQRNQTPQMLPAPGPPLAWSCPAVSALLSGEDREGRSRRLQRGQRNHSGQRSKERAVGPPAAASPGPPGSSRLGAGGTRAAGRESQRRDILSLP